MVDLSDVSFMAMMVVTIGGAIVALEAKEVVYGAIGLAGSLFGVAALFFLLDSPFVAVFQITVYVGAVAVLILFTVMLVREGMWKSDSPNAWGRLAGILTAGALAISLVLSFTAGYMGATEQAAVPSFVNIGQMIVTRYSPALEVLALVLAASVLGAMALAKVEKEDAA